MGKRTNIILIIDRIHNQKKMLDLINEWFNANDEPEIQLATNTEHGGEGSFSAMILTGRYNYFDVQSLIDFLKKEIGWKDFLDAYMCQLLFQREALFYTTVQIFPAETPQSNETGEK